MRNKQGGTTTHWVEKSKRGAPILLVRGAHGEPKKDLKR